MVIGFYLHIKSSADTDEETKNLDESVHPMTVDDVGLTFEDWHQDEMFYAFPVFSVTEKLKSLIDYWLDEHKIKFTNIERVNKGLNFQGNYPDSKLGKFWRAEME